MRLKHVAGLLFILAISPAARAGDGDDCEAELKRIRKAYEAAHVERAKMARELAAARKRIAELEASRAVTSTQPVSENDPRAWILVYFKAIVERWPSGSTQYEANLKLGIMRLVRAPLQDLCKGPAGAKALFGPALEYMDQAVQVQRQNVAALPPDQSTAGAAKQTRPAASRFLVGAALLKAELEAAVDRVEAAKIAGKWIGRKVEWTGTVIVGPNRYVSGWEYMLDCDGMTVRATLAFPVQGNVAVGSSVHIAGTIDGEDADIVNLGVVHLTGCEIATDAAYWELVKKRR